MIVKCLVACETGNGPDIVFVQVDCTQEQYDHGEHYRAAKDWAMDQDYEGPMVAMDENDPAKPLFHLFEWDTAFIISTPYGD